MATVYLYAVRLRHASNVLRAGLNDAYQQCRLRNRAGNSPGSRGNAQLLSLMLCNCIQRGATYPNYSMQKLGFTPVFERYCGIYNFVRIFSYLDSLTIPRLSRFSCCHHFLSDLWDFSCVKINHCCSAWIRALRRV